MLINCDTYQNWNERVEKAKADGESVKAVLLDSIAFAVKNQDIIGTKLGQIDHIHNETIEEKDGTEGIKFIFAESNGNVFHYATCWFRPATEQDVALPSTLQPNEDGPRTARFELSEIFKGSSELSFMYTPFVLMVTRMFDIDIEDFHVKSDNNAGTWSIDAIAQDFVLHASISRAVLEQYIAK